MPFEVFQLWSQPGTRLVRIKTFPEQWITPTRYRPEFGVLRSWIKDSGESSPKINLAALAAMVFSTAVSGGIWVGIAWLALHLVKH